MTREPLGGDSPGATPLDDVSGLIPKHVHTKAELHAVEAINISKAVTKYLGSRPSKRKAPFTWKWVCRLHKEMFGDVWKWAGLPRRAALNIGAPAHQIDVQMTELLADLAYWLDHKTFPIDEQAARLHHRAVQIHPFTNGNGRWSRLLANILLRREGLQPTLWPEETIGAASVIRDAYLQAVRAADRYDMRPLLELQRRYTPTTTRGSN